MSSSESLRKAMVTLVINKRSEKVQQKIAQQVSQTLKEWGNSFKWLREHYGAVEYTHQIG